MAWRGKIKTELFVDTEYRRSVIFSAHLVFLQKRGQGSAKMKQQAESFFIDAFTEGPIRYESFSMMQKES